MKYLGWLAAALLAGVGLGYLFWGRYGKRLRAAVAERDELQAVLEINGKQLAGREAELAERTAELQQSNTAVASLTAELDAARATIAQQADAIAEAQSVSEEVQRLSNVVAEHHGVIAHLRARNWNIETKLDDLLGMLDLRAGPDEIVPPVPSPPDLDAAAEAFGRPLEMDDLEAVEGIGPKVAEVLRDAGIATWWGLAHADLRRLRRILAAAGPRFQLQRPDTWPRQAMLLAEGKWSEFMMLTSTLTGGKEH
jgi:predicted flap endonuclease-1-like 5' DNA nuclease